MRTINTLQASQPGAARHIYLSHDQLITSPYAERMRASTDGTVKQISLEPAADILPNWQLTLDVTQQGYWFMIKDKIDPCGFVHQQ